MRAASPRLRSAWKQAVIRLGMGSIRFDSEEIESIPHCSVCRDP